ncbi:MAG: hypothetical protein S4CHLAM7_01330 [Chlamydiae bacterium]|nr:hypothetical protein [Chlamydiota bacterium]
MIRILMTAIALTLASSAQAEVVCSFCKPDVLAKQTIYEDDQVVILYNHKPAIRGHCMVIPKRHVERLEDLNEGEVLAVHEAISNLFRATFKSYESTGYDIFQKNGKEAGQSVPHVHVHFLPRKENDYWDIGLYLRLFSAQFQSTLSKEQLQEEVANLSQSFSYLKSDL